MYRIGFIIEKALGHVTHGKNLQRYVPQDAEVEAHWVLPEWEPHELLANLPLYKSNWTVRAGLQTRRALADLHRRTPLDALFFHTQVTAVLSPDWLRRIPSIVSLDATPLQYDTLGDSYQHVAGPQWVERWKWYLNRDCFRAARHLVTWSEWAKKGLVDEYGVPAGKITVISPGVDVQAWECPEREPRPGGPVKILFVGGDFRRKGGHVLLEAFRQLHQNHSSQIPVELHLVTRDPALAEPGVFVYNDLSPNSASLKQLYFDSDIFCMPTAGDCLPMVLSEAGAAGLPLVSTRIGGIPEIVRDGETGLLVPVGDPAALAAALRRLVCEPELRRRMGARAVEVVRRDYDAGLNSARLLALLKQAVKEPVTIE